MSKQKVFAREIKEDEFYGHSIFDALAINPLTYKGRGRPRDTDYITLSEVVKIENGIYSKYIDGLVQKAKV